MSYQTDRRIRYLGDRQGRVQSCYGIGGTSTSGRGGVLCLEGTNGTRVPVYFWATAAGVLKSSTTFPTNTESGTSVGALGSGATVALDNLASVAINSALIPGANGTIDLGSATYRFRTLYTGVTGIIAYGTTYKDTISFTEPAANRTITFGDPGGADSVAYLAAAQALTNKTIVAGSNTISGITAAMQIGTTGSAGMVLTNQGATSAPTWTTPTFATLAQTSYIEAGTYDITLSTTTQTTGIGTLTIPDLAGATHRIMTVSTTGLAAGDIFYYNGTQIVRLAKGTGSYFLKMNSGATAPEWAVS